MAAGIMNARIQNSWMICNGSQAQAKPHGESSSFSTRLYLVGNEARTSQATSSSSIVLLIYLRRRKRSPAVIEQRNDSKEAMSQTLDSYMVPTMPPKRRRLTKEERLCVAYVRKMKACPSCWQKHPNVQNRVFYIVGPVALCAGRQFWLTPTCPLKQWTGNTSFRHPGVVRMILTVLQNHHLLATAYTAFWLRFINSDSHPLTPESFGPEKSASDTLASSGWFWQCSKITTFWLRLTLHTLTSGYGSPRTEIIPSIYNFYSIREITQKRTKVRKRVLSNEHPDTLHSMSNLAFGRDQSKRYSRRSAKIVAPIRSAALGQAGTSNWHFKLAGRSRAKGRQSLAAVERYLHEEDHYKEFLINGPQRSPAPNIFPNSPCNAMTKLKHITKLGIRDPKDSQDWSQIGKSKS